jgi:hypothetical protein
MGIEFKDETYVKEDGIGVIYLAGGCFWGLQKLMKTIPGVITTTSGYANGDPSLRPTYRKSAPAGQVPRDGGGSNTERTK